MAWSKKLATNARTSLNQGHSACYIYPDIDLYDLSYAIRVFWLKVDKKMKKNAKKQNLRLSAIVPKINHVLHRFLCRQFALSV
jgi:hypothetical protein